MSEVKNLKLLARMSLVFLFVMAGCNPKEMTKEVSAAKDEGVLRNSEWENDKSDLVCTIFGKKEVRINRAKKKMRYKTSQDEAYFDFFVTENGFDIYSLKHKSGLGFLSSAKFKLAEQTVSLYSGGVGVPTTAIHKDIPCHLAGSEELDKNQSTYKEVKPSLICKVSEGWEIAVGEQGKELQYKTPTQKFLFHLMKKEGDKKTFSIFRKTGREPVYESELNQALKTVSVYEFFKGGPKKVLHKEIPCLETN